MQHPSTCSCSRRSFLKGCGVTLSGFGVASLFPESLINHVMASAGAAGKRVLFIFLRGGNDGINAVIPHGDPQYNDTMRPTLYIDPLDAVDLNGFASLHPALADMMSVYTPGELAVIHRVGYANNSLSHFDGQRIWENGDPTQPQLFDGWLARYIAENSLSMGADLPALSVQASQPLLLRGEEKYVNIANPDSFNYATGDIRATKYKEAWRNISSNLVGLEAYRPVLAETGVKLADTLDEYDSWDQANWNPTDPVTGFSLFPVSGATNQKGLNPASYGFFRSLKVCALSLLESDGTNNNNTRIAGTQVTGWDLHNNQGGMNGPHANLLSYLGYAFHSLRLALSGQAIDPRSYADIWNDTVVVTMSEFGRTTDQNGSLGTDHASASCMWVAGGSVNGGVYNCDGTTWPAGVMYGINGRYLALNTDYRSVFWEVLRDHMGAAASGVETVFPGYGSLGLGGQELGLIGT